MANEVDNRIVKLEFDNHQFEAKTSQSMKTLDQISKSIDSVDGKSLDKLGAAFVKVNDHTNIFSAAINKVSGSFSALEIAAITAISNITTSLQNAAVGMLKELTIDNVAAGWQKFGELTTSTGTLISQGFDLDEVESQLERLNWYTDETSYNFTDMVNNIGKFTASGKGLEDSVTAMEGIANWAALSGANAEKASSAMYQLSQAMSAGYMDLQNYRSIQNVGMDTQEFRKKVLDTALKYGTISVAGTDDAGNTLYSDGSDNTFTVNSFTERLAKGKWFTGDIMMDVFQQYSSAVDQIYEYADENGLTASQAIEELSGSVDEFGLKAFKAAQEARTFSDVVDALKDAASTTWMNIDKNIFGNYEEAKELWTDLANEAYGVFVEPLNSINSIFKVWKEIGGRDDALRAFWNLWNTIVSIMNAVKEAFLEVWPLITGEELADATKSFADLTEKLLPSLDTLQKIKDVFIGIFSVIDWTVIKPIKVTIYVLQNLFTLIKDGFKWIYDKLSSNDKISKALSSVVEWFKELFNSIREFMNDTESMRNAIDAAFQTIRRALVTAYNAISTALTTVIDKIKEFYHILKGDNNIKDSANSIKEVGDQAEDASDKISIFVKVLNWVETAASTVWGALKNVAAWIKATWEVIANSEFAKVVIDIFNRVKEPILKLKDALVEFFDQAVAKFKTGDFTPIYDLFGVLTSGALTIGGIQIFSDFVEVFHTFADAFKSLTSGGSVISNIKTIGDTLVSTLGNIQQKVKAERLKNIAIAVLALAGALLIVSLIEEDKLLKCLGIVSSLAIIVGSVLGIFSLIEKRKPKPATITTITDTFGKAIGESLTNFINSFTTTVSEIGQAIKKAIKIISLAAFIAVIAAVLAKLTKYDFWDIMTSLAEVVIAVGLLMSLVKIIDQYQISSLKGTSSLLIMAGVIAVIAGSLWLLDKTKLNGSVLTNLAIVLAAIISIAAIFKIIDELNISNKAILKFSGAMVVFSIAVAAVALVATLASKLKGTESGLITMAEVILLMGVALKAIDVLDVSTKKVIKFAAAMLLMAGAVAVIALVANALKALDLEAFEKLGILLGIMLAFSALAGFTAKPFLVFATALSLVATSFLVTAVAINIFAVGLASLTAVLIPFALAFASSMAILLGSISVLSSMMKQAGIAIVNAIAGIVVEAADAIETIINKIISTFFKSLFNTAQEAALQFIEFVIYVLDLAIDNAATIIDKVIDLIIIVLDKLTERMPELIQSIVDFVVSIFDSVVLALEQYDWNEIVTGLKAVGLLGAMVVELALIVGFIPGAMIGVVGLGLLFAELAVVFGYIGEWISNSNISKSSIETAMEWLVIISEGLGSAIGGFIGGAIGEMSVMLKPIADNISYFIETVGAAANKIELTEASKTSITALSDIVVAIGAATFIEAITMFTSISDTIDSFSEGLPKLGTAVKGFNDNVTGINTDTISVGAEATKILCEAMKDVPRTGKSVISFFAGDYHWEDFSDGLSKVATGIVAFSDTTSGINVETVTPAAEAAKILFEAMSKIPKTGVSVKSIFAGDYHWDKFATGMEDVGKGIYNFSINTDGMNYDGVKKASECLEDLLTVMKDIPTSTGLLAAIFGVENADIVYFAGALPSLGAGIKGFSDAVINMDKQAILKGGLAAGVLKSIVDATKDITPSTGIFSWFTGDQYTNLTKFGEAVPSLGVGIAGFASEVSSIENDTLNKATIASLVLGTLSTAFATISGEDYDSDKIKNLGTDMTTIALKVTRTSTLLKKFDSESLSNFGVAINTFYTNIAPVFNEDGSTKFKSLADDLSALANAGALTFSSSFVASTEEISKAVNDWIKSISFVVKSNTYADSSYLNSFKLLAQEPLNAFKNKFNQDSDSVKTTVKNVVVTNLVNELKGKSAESNWRSVAASYISTFKNAFINNTPSVRTTMYLNLVTYAVNKLKDGYSEYYNVGKYYVEGFKNGIEDNQSLATKSARTLGQKTTQTLKNSVQEKSPSKAAYRIGDYFVQGFANGISDNSRLAIASAFDMGKDTTSSLNSAMSKLATLVDNDVDLSPTIRPIMDLSEIQNGIHEIDGMYGNFKELNVSANAISLSHNGYLESKNSNQEISQGENSGNTYSFTQNNYSPKALSNIEIYRQTKNQFATFKKATGI